MADELAGSTFVILLIGIAAAVQTPVRGRCLDTAGATALMAAAGKGRMEEAAALLAAGADAAARATDGSTARDWAAKFGHEDVAAYLDSLTQVCCDGLNL